MILSLFRRVCQAVLLGEPVTLLVEQIEKLRAEQHAIANEITSLIENRNSDRAKQLGAVNDRVGGVTSDTLSILRDLHKLRDDLAKKKPRRKR